MCFVMFFAAVAPAMAAEVVCSHYSVSETADEHCAKDQDQKQAKAEYEDCDCCCHHIDAQARIYAPLPFNPISQELAFGPALALTSADQASLYKPPIA